MEIKSLKYNIIMSLMRMITGILYPIIIMPYINRILSPTGIGEIEYATTITNYFILFANIGIPIYGIREVSKVKNSLKEKSKLTLELVIILGITTILSYTIYIWMIYINTNFKNKILLLIFSLNILFTSLGVEWFYQGIENQKYITIKAILIRLISFIFIFIIVKNKNDINKYALIMVLGTVGSNIFNIINLKNYININKNLFKDIELKKHIKSIFITFFAAIATMIYTQIDIIMLGKITGMEAVGLYNLSVKFLRLFTSVITVIGTTVLPRLTYMYNQNNPNYEEYLKNIYKIILFYGSYICIFLNINSLNIIEIFGGVKFLPAVLTLKIISYIVVISGIGYYLGIIILYSKKKDKYFLYSVCFAAIINFLLNCYMIPLYGEVGAAISTLCAESFVILFILIFGKKFLKNIRIVNINTSKYFISILITIIFLRNYNIYINNILINLILKTLLSFFLYINILIILKEQLIIDILKRSYKICINIFCKK